MNGKLSRQREDQQRLIERAAQWFNVLENPSAEERAEFIEWIGRSPRHLEEFLLTTAVAREIQRVDLQSSETVREALATESARVVPLREDAFCPAHREKEDLVPSSDRRGKVKVGAAVAALLAAAILVFAITAIFLPGPSQSYVTAAGEQRTIELPDVSFRGACMI